MKIFAVLFSLALAGGACGETYYLAQSDTRQETRDAAPTSFSTAARWSLDGSLTGLTAPSGDNDYVIPGGMSCYGGTNLSVLTGSKYYSYFPGRSLTVKDGGALHVSFLHLNRDSYQSVVTNLTIEPGGTVWAQSYGNSWQDPFYVNHGQTMTVSGTPEKPAMFVMNDFVDARGDTTMRRSGFYKLAGTGDLVVSNTATTRALFVTKAKAYRNGHMFYPNDLSAFSGRLILNGSPCPADTTMRTLAQWDYQNLQNFAGTLVMRDYACLTFRTNEKFKRPIILEEGGNELWFRLQSDTEIAPQITGPVSGAGNLLVISCGGGSCAGGKEHSGESFWIKHTLVVTNTVWDASGTVTISNCTLAVGDVYFKTLPKFVLGPGGTLTMNGEEITADTRLVGPFDEEATTWPDWSAEVLADLEGRTLKIVTARSAAMFDGKGALRVVKLPAGATADTFPVKQFLSPTRSFQADWLAAPVWGIDAEGYLTVTLTRKPDEAFKKTAKGMDQNSTWQVPGNWQDGTLPVPGEHCLSTEKFFSSGELFTGASLTIATGKIFTSRYGLQVEHLYLNPGTTVEVYFENSRTVFEQGHGCSILGTAEWPVVFRNPNNYGNNCRLKLPLVGGSDAVLKFSSSDNTSTSAENTSAATSTSVRGWHLEAPSPEYRGRIIVQAWNKETATNAHYHVFAACEEALGAAPKTLRADALTISNRFTDIAFNNIVTLRNEPGTDLDLLSPNRGITVGGVAGFRVDDGTMTVAGPVRLTGGDCGKWGDGTLTLKGGATAQPGAAFFVADGTFKPLVAECFKDARLVFTNAVTLAVDPDASADAAFKENGLVNTAKVSVDGDLSLALTLPAVCAEKRVWRVPVMTAPAADAAALVAAFRRSATFANVPAGLDTTGIVFVATPSPAYPGCSVVKAGIGNVSTILILR